MFCFTVFLSINQPIWECDIRYLPAVLAALLLAACSGESYDRYVGLWKRENGGSPAVLAITKEYGKTYLLNENILQETDFLETRNKAVCWIWVRKGRWG
ncbi:MULTISPECIES: hypothetical protein [unclassified Neisseria]|uniref:hypothetical protein n=1 Tax=unclassified Neisseria TaxID=2623750 RepID=UPI00107182A0|nr:MULTISPECIES: hypothetical protein [unclassified Neisseria]MBF0803253.1 hypothetical protein [Neisseria sp. 19428wB4_WF04]TFU44092.1 hypothetical protein E4T99_02595 [Neisseria sp. WF04]